MTAGKKKEEQQGEGEMFGWRMLWFLPSVFVLLVPSNTRIGQERRAWSRGQQ
jgi:hypothetical protein